MLPDAVIGAIGLWSGTVVTIPAGWSLCDGTNGTPDLRDKFIVGAGAIYNPGDSGGSADHTHTFQTDGHVHNLISGTYAQPGPNFSGTVNSVFDIGTSGNNSNNLPYYSLAYIMYTGV